MRPIRLSVRGLRSYRGQTEIDFSGRNLIAIVGDTGAGKSSILEGITYALYNATTWDAGAVKQLIADGAQHMSVQLDFLARGRAWRVHRACSRSGYPPSVHRLTCLDDAGIAGADGEEAVNGQVTRLLGMSHRAFLAAVILPQGRFQTLLQERPAERTRILEGIFRLTELRAVRGAADELKQRAQLVVRALEARRSGLLPDPAAAAELRERELAESAEREAMLQRLLRTLGESIEAERAGEEALRTVRQPAHRLRAVDRGSVRLLAALVPQAAGLEAELAGAVDGERALREREQELARAIAAADAREESVEDLARAGQALRGGRRRLEEIAQGSLRLAEERRRIEAEAAALQDRQAGLAELERRWRSCRDSVAPAREAADAALEQRSRAAERLALVRGAAEAARRATAERGRRVTAVGRLERLAEEAARAAAEGAGRLALARGQLAAEQRRNAGAHAAEGLRSGDPCPVCATELPDGFRAPAAAELTPHTEGVRALEAADQELRTAAAGATADLAAARERAGEASQLAVEAELRLSRATAGLGEVLPDADLDRQDADLLAVADERVAALGEAAGEAARTAEDARARLDAERAGFDSRSQGLDSRRRAADAERLRLDQALAGCRTELAALPPALSPGAQPTGELLEALEAEAGRRLAAARERRDRREALLREQREAARRVERLRERRDREVEEPRRRAAQAMEELRLRLADGLQAVGRSLPPPTVDHGAASLAEQAALAEELGALADDVLLGLERRAAELEAEAADRAAAIARELAESGFSGSADVEQELRAAQQRIGEARGRLEEARLQVPVANALERRIARAGELRHTLEELVRLLADGQFIRHVIERRQRTLLAVASGTLAGMTGNRFGFSETFEIVDRLSGQPRATRTLSGGETFLASLALALALVEIAGRSGTQLHALFLDEGFGALDANALDEALNALERRADGGRLVAVVSHVRAVAERIETVLEVTRTPTGSHAVWRGPSERDEMLGRELEAGLLG